MSEPKKIAFFVGNDITAQLVLNGVIKDIYENRLDHNGEARYEPVVYLPAQPASIKANLPELKEFAFYERGILNDVVFPYVDENAHMRAKNLSPSKLSEKYGFELKKVPAVNDPEFVRSLAEANRPFAGAFSIRCFQIFKEPIIAHFNQRSAEGAGFFLNAHPGILPNYRGVMSTVRTMHADVMDPPQRYGWTLHEVDRGIDTGDILWVKARTDVDKLRPAVLVNAFLAPTGVNAIKAAFDNLDNNEELAGYPQDKKVGKYYTYPTKRELKEWKDSGIKLVDRNGTVKKLVEEFSVPGTAHAEELAVRMHKAIDKFEEENKPDRLMLSTSSLETPEGGKKTRGQKSFTAILRTGGMPDPSPA
jgi:hypothetical protein